MILDVYCDDAYLFRKIEIELDGAYAVRRFPKKAADGVGIFEVSEGNDRFLILKLRSEAAEQKFQIPFALGELKTAILNSFSKKPILRLGEKCVYLGEEEIKLTELEFALISLLYKRRDFVSKEDILKAVWSGEVDRGIVNVYIHYLREKLEDRGAKVILSSRQRGYSINPVYMGGEY